MVQMSGRGLEHWLLAAILAGAALVRSHDLGRNSYWNDELASLAASNGQPLWSTLPRPGVFPEARPRITRVEGMLPLPQVVFALVDDSHPPLYFLALRGWRNVLGDGEAEDRALSVVASLVGILFLFDAVRSLQGGASALWAALFLALAVPDIAMARETRSYAWLLALVRGGAAAVARLEARGPGRRRAIALGLAASAAMLTHYYAAFALVPLALYAVLRLPAPGRRAALLALVVAGALFVAAWGPFLWESRHAALTNNQWQRAPQDAGLHVTLARVANLPLRLLWGPTWQPVPRRLWPILVFLALVAVGWRQRGASFWMLWLAGTAGFVVALDLLTGTRLLMMQRYVIAATPAACALAPALLSRLPARLAHALLAAGAAALAFHVPAVYAREPSPWRGFVRALERRQAPGEPVVLTFRDPDMSLAYKALLHYSEGPARRQFLLPADPSPLAIDKVRRFGPFWLVTSSDPASLIPDARVTSRFERPGKPTAYRVE
jgi:hypothetical protein